MTCAYFLTRRLKDVAARLKFNNSIRGMVLHQITDTFPHTQTSSNQRLVSFLCDRQSLNPLSSNPFPLMI